MFSLKAEQGDPDFSSYWSSVLQDVGDYEYPSIAEGLNAVINERKVLHSTAEQIKSYLQSNPEFLSKVSTLVLANKNLLPT